MGSEENDCIQNQIIHSEIQNKSTEDSEYMQVDYYHVDHTKFYYNGHFHIESSLFFLPQCLNIIQIELPPIPFLLLLDH